MSKEEAAPPNEQLAMFNLPPSRPDKAILKPWPYLPIKLALGTLQSSRITKVVGCTFHPNYNEFVKK